MTINKVQNGTALEIALEGRLDTMTAPQLESELSKAMPDAETLTLDCSKLEYISSAGLRVLLSAHKAMARKGLQGPDTEERPAAAAADGGNDGPDARNHRREGRAVLDRGQRWRI